MPALRHPDTKDEGRRPRHLLLPALPAAPAAARSRYCGQQLLEAAVAISLDELAEAAEGPLADHDLGEGHLPRQRHEVGAAFGVAGQVDLENITPRLSSSAFACRQKQHGSVV